MLDFSQNYYELFDLQVGFDLDAAALAQRYRSLQGVLHPDRFASVGDHERRLALQAATRVNEAYQTLRRPLSRAIYLLELHGEGMQAQAETTRDAEFLMEQMELREALGAIESSASPATELERLLERIQLLYDKHLQALGEQFDGDEVHSISDAQDTVCKVQFLDKLMSEAERIQAQLEEKD